jgi:hypothetical protein
MLSYLPHEELLFKSSLISTYTLLLIIIGVYPFPLAYFVWMFVVYLEVESVKESRFFERRGKIECNVEDAIVIYSKAISQYLLVRNEKDRTILRRIRVEFPTEIRTTCLY